MSAEIEISSVFGRYTNEQLNIKVEGKTVGECINDLVRQYPDIGKVLLDKNGKLGHSYDVFINGESAYPVDMAKSVSDGDKLNIVMLIYGG
jgi:molybdopterin converting factor small subunit